jgi:acyl-CoA thioesterase I
MRVCSRFGAIFAVLFAAVQAFAADPPEVSKVAAMLGSGQEPVRIVCFGDSVTGVYYHSGSRRAWPDMLQIALKKAYPKAKVEVFNAGISGHTTTAGLERMDRDVIAHKPHLVVVMFGLNDILAGDKKLYRSNLETIVRRCRQSGAAVVFCTPNSVYPNNLDPQAAVAEYSQIVRDLAKQNSVPVADCFLAFEAVRAGNPTEWMLLMAENIHPCMDGHKLIAATVAGTIAGKPISLADVPPPADGLRFTMARLKAGQPVAVIAMPPYDRIIPEVLAELFPRAKVNVTTWPVEGQSLAEMVKWSEGIRGRSRIANLVVLAVPAGANAKDTESFIRQYNTVRSNCVGFARAEWDWLPILLSVTAPVAPSDLERAELARRVIVGGDVEYVDRKPNDTRPARQMLLEWIRARGAKP